MNELAELLKANWGYVAVLLPLLIGGIGLLLRGRLQGEALRVVGAVYRVAMHEAALFQDAGMTWLLSEKGIEFRKRLVETSYDALPGKLTFLKVFVSREAFCSLVERAFVATVRVADRLEMPEDLTVEVTLES
jgi:hypothetical protein